MKHKSGNQLADLLDQLLELEKLIIKEKNSIPFLGNQLSQEKLKQKKATIWQSSETLKEIESRIIDFKENVEFHQLRIKTCSTIKRYISWVNNNSTPGLLFPLLIYYNGRDLGFFRLLQGELSFRLKSGDFNPMNYIYKLESFQERAINPGSWCNINKVNRFLEKEFELLMDTRLNYLEIYRLVQGLVNRWVEFEHNGGLLPCNIRKDLSSGYIAGSQLFSS